MSIYLTSDWHFGHDKEFIWGARGFSSIDEMNEELIKRHNSIVAPEDDVYALGDLMLGEPDNIEYIERLNGKLHIVLGNHDTDRRKDMYRLLDKTVEISLCTHLRYHKYNFILTHYPTYTGNPGEDHLKQMTLNIHGHTHSKFKFFEDRVYMYNCGIDAHDGYPVSIDKIISDMKVRIQCSSCKNSPPCKHDIINGECSGYKLGFRF